VIDVSGTERRVIDVSGTKTKSIRVRSFFPKAAVDITLT